MMIVADPLLQKQRSSSKKTGEVSRCGADAKHPSDAAGQGGGREKVRALKKALEGDLNDETRQFFSDYVASLSSKYGKMRGLFKVTQPDAQEPLDDHWRALEDSESNGSLAGSPVDCGRIVVLVSMLEASPLLSAGGQDGAGGENQGWGAPGGGSQPEWAESSFNVKDAFRKVKGEFLKHTTRFRDDPAKDWSDQDKSNAAGLLMKFARGERLSGTEATTAASYVKHLNLVADRELGISTNPNGGSSVPSERVFRMGLETLEHVDSPSYRSPKSPDQQQKIAFDAAKMTVNFLLRELKRERPFAAMAREDSSALASGTQAELSFKDALRAVSKKLAWRGGGSDGWNDSDTGRALDTLGTYAENGPGSVSGQYAPLLVKYVRHLADVVAELKAFKGAEPGPGKPGDLSAERRSEGYKAILRYEAAGGLYNHTYAEIAAFKAFVEYMVAMTKADQALRNGAACSAPPPLVGGAPVYHLDAGAEERCFRVCKRVLKGKVDVRHLTTADRSDLKRFVYNAIARSGGAGGGAERPPGPPPSAKSQAKAFKRYFALSGAAPTKFASPEDAESYAAAIARLRDMISTDEFRYVGVCEPNPPPLARENVDFDPPAGRGASGPGPGHRQGREGSPAPGPRGSAAAGARIGSAWDNAVEKTPTATAAAPKRAHPISARDEKRIRALAKTAAEMKHDDPNSPDVQKLLEKAQAYPTEDDRKSAYERMKVYFLSEVTERIRSLQNRGEDADRDPDARIK